MKKNKKNYDILVIGMLIALITMLCVIDWSYDEKTTKKNVPQNIVMSTIDVDSIAAHSDEQIETKTTLNIPTSTQTIKQKKKKYKTAYIKANDLNLRKKANVKSKSIKRLFYGKKIEFIIINKKCQCFFITNVIYPVIFFLVNAFPSYYSDKKSHRSFLFRENLRWLFFLL